MKGLEQHYDSLSPPDTTRKRPQRRSRIPSITLLLLAFVYAAYLVSRPSSLPTSSDPFHWKQCAPHDAHYLCGYLTVPLDYTNVSDPRVVHIATKLYQPFPGHKSEKTLIIEPGGECPL